MVKSEREGPQPMLQELVTALRPSHQEGWEATSSCQLNRLWADESRLSVMYLTEGKSFLHIGLGKARTETPSNHLITLTRFLDQPAAADNCELTPAPLDETFAFELSRSNGDGWSLDAEHRGKQVLSYRQCVAVAAVMHHQQPAREPLLEIMSAIACRRHHDLL
jgi:hypothetical protein